MSDENPDLYDEFDGAGEYVAEDPDDLYRVRRYRHILDARQRFDVVEARSLAADIEDRATAVAVVACGFLRQLEPIIRRSDSNLLRREVTIGQQPHRVETEDGPYRAWTDARTATVSHLLDTSGTLQDEVEVNERTFPVTATMQPDTSARLVRLGDDFLEDVMPINLTEDSRTASADYTDIL